MSKLKNKILIILKGGSTVEPVTSNFHILTHSFEI